MVPEVHKLEIKYYVVYGKGKPELTDADKIKAAVEEWKKVVEENDMKIVIWGAPFGVSEDAFFVYKGTTENYLKLVTSGKQPYTNDRTHMILKF
jgi:hypothetical protein